MRKEAWVAQLKGTQPPPVRASAVAVLVTAKNAASKLPPERIQARRKLSGLNRTDVLATSGKRDTAAIASPLGSVTTPSLPLRLPGGVDFRATGTDPGAAAAGTDPRRGVHSRNGSWRCATTMAQGLSRLSMRLGKTNPISAQSSAECKPDARTPRGTQSAGCIQNACTPRRGTLNAPQRVHPSRLAPCRRQSLTFASCSESTKFPNWDLPMRANWLELPTQTSPRGSTRCQRDRRRSKLAWCSADSSSVPVGYKLSPPPLTGDSYQR